MEPIKHEMQDIRLTAAETGHLWSTYMLESIVHHMLSYFSKNVEDENIKDIILINVDMTQDSLGLLESTFKKNNLPVPRGAKSEDINLNAPRLYSDIFYVQYFIIMSQYALLSYSLAYAQSSREDIREFFLHYLNRLSLVNKQVTELSLEKGLYIRPPSITTQDTVDFVKDKSYTAGFMVEKRALTVLEIIAIFHDAYANAIGKALLTGFIQVTKSAELQQYFIRRKELSNKYFQNFTGIFLNEDISVPPSFDGEVIDNTDAPFTDRFMLLHSFFLSSFGISTYGRALSLVQRHDLTALYVKIVAEVGIYSNDGIKLMIENEWLEQPPSAGR